MQELIAIHTRETDTGTVQTVDGRELHAFLESKQQFSHWIKGRIDQYGFVQGVDFTTIDNFIYSPPRTEYALTLDMAKELAMVERNEKGKQARQYFIECERQAKAVPSDPYELLVHQAQLLLQSERRQRELEARQKSIEVQQQALAQQQVQTTARLDRIETATDHFTVVGYARYLRRGDLTLAEAARLGRAASIYCKDHEIEMGEVPDPRFGRVKTYPKWVLDSIMDSIMGGTH